MDMLGIIFKYCIYLGIIYTVLFHLLYWNRLIIDVRQTTRLHKLEQHSQMHNETIIPGVVLTPKEQSKIFDKKLEYSVKETQEQRKKLIEDVCKKYNDLNDKRSVRQKSRNLFTEDERRFMYCYIPKVSNTNWKRALAISSGKIDAAKLKELAIKLKAYDELNPSMVVQRREFLRLLHFYYAGHSPHLREADIEVRVKRYFKFLFVRNPYIRLLSAYRDLYEYKKPKQFQSNLFYKSMGATILRKFRNKKKKWAKKHGREVKFKEFLRYILYQHQNNQTFNEHYEKIWFMCNPCWIKFDFIGKMETLAEDADHILKHLGATKGFEEFPSSLLSPSSLRSGRNTTAALLAFYSDITVDIMEGIQEVYKYDFELFGYSKELPVW